MTAAVPCKGRTSLAGTARPGSARARTAWRPCARTTTDPSGYCPTHRPRTAA